MNTVLQCQPEAGCMQAMYIINQRPYTAHTGIKRRVMISIL